MLKFSESEYAHLKKEVSEIRTYITRLMGYIVTVAGLSAYFLELVFDSADPIREIIAVFISVIIITILFEIIWYKFKSHNRYTGYIQLLMQETDYIDREEVINNKELFDSKGYVKNYKEHLERNPSFEMKGKNVLSWEFVMSRLYSSGHGLTGKGYYNGHKRLTKSINNIQFVFKLPHGYEYSYLKDKSFKYLDVEFSMKVTRKLYGIPEKSFFIRIGNGLCRLYRRVRNNLYSKINRFIRFLNKKMNVNYSLIKIKKIRKLDKRYVVNGWRYPKLITHIALLVISILTMLFVVIISTEMDYVPYSEREIRHYLAPSLFVLIIAVFLFWLYKFKYGLKDILNGRHSIDGYCWTFFVYRVQFLNSMGIIPVYFSRSFVRFFKSRLISDCISNPDFLEKIDKESKNIHVCVGCKKEAEKEINKDCKKWNLYKYQMNNLIQFKDADIRNLHCVINKTMKEEFDVKKRG